ncbi:MAG: glycosyltransferase family 39 protein [Acidobacteriota bacterium]
MSCWILLGIIAVALVFHLWGIKRNLPFMPEPDEKAFVTPAVRIAASGDLDPGWFGHPGSTVIYPLAGVYHIWNSLAHGGRLLRSDPELQARFDSAPGEFYLIGRLLAISYAIASLPLIYLLGRRIFDWRVGLIAAWFSALTPLAVSYAKTVRSDSAAVFFGVLALWLCLRVYDRPSTRNQVATGAAVGLAIATRYFMAALIPVLLAVDGLIFWRKRTHREIPGSLWIGVAAGLLAIAVAFVVTTPYLLLRLTTAVNDLQFEARDTAIGTSGSRTGNFFWYLTTGIPMSVPWPQLVLAVVGIGLAIRKRTPPPMLLLGMVTVFLFEISLMLQHVERWLVPILPLFSVLAAYALSVVIDHSSTRFHLSLRARQALFAASLALVSAWSIYQLVRLDIRHSSPSTPILARDWIIENLEPGSRIALDRFTAPLTETDFVVSKHRGLARNRTLDYYYREGYRYIVASSAMYDAYMAERDLYRSEAEFYSRLFDEGRLLQEFVPSPSRDGSVIRIYELKRD